MKCSICKGEIETHRDPDTNQIIWDQGNNADPINDGRCCDNCNATKVIPARFEMHRKKQVLLTHNDTELLEEYAAEKAEARACGDLDFPSFREWSGEVNPRQAAEGRWTYYADET